MIGKLLKRFWHWWTEPSSYGLWSKAFERLQVERKHNGRSSEYWRIWYEEVCPAYRSLSEGTPKILRHHLTGNILDDMDKPLNQRKHF